MKTPLFVSAIAAIAASHSAHALPSFARQTGQDCVACHVGGFGPQLTPFGMKFKITGYVDSNGEKGKVPLSAMVIASNTRTKKDQDAPPDGTSRVNNNTVLDEASVFLAGRVTENLGSFTQVTYDGLGKKLAIDQMDVRYAKTVQAAGKDLVLGLSINNNPMTQDPFNTGTVWGYPYNKSNVAPTPGAATLINGGLEQRVLGLSGYGFWNDSVYGELGTYRSLSLRAQQKVGLAVADDPGRLNKSNLYWRLAYLGDQKKRAYTVGLFGLDARLAPDRNVAVYDKYRDIGVDGSYMFLGTRKHVATVYGSYVRERRSLNSMPVVAGDPTTARLNEFKLTGAYHYDQTYGFNLSRFRTSGTTSATLYGDGYANASPNSSGWIYQVDWTPWGKENSWHAPNANVRVGAQYVQYTQFNGAKFNYDGNGRNARDNNTLYLFLWSAF